MWKDKSKHWTKTDKREKTMEKIRRARAEQVFSKDSQIKKGISIKRWNKEHPETQVNKGKKISIAKFGKERIDMIGNVFAKGNKPNRTAFQKGQTSKEKNVNWLGGKSFEPYGVEFNKELRNYIRQKYNYRCQQCFRHQDELNRKLSIHHIDFNKRNNSENNLIPLCNICHLQTNYNRQEWTKYFQNKVVG